MSEVFQIVCKSCNSKLNAKVSLIGQTRNCPKCKTPVLIQQHALNEIPSPEIPGSEFISNPDSVKVPQLEFQNRYFIIGLDRVVAVWEGSKGWHVNVGSGFAPARSNMEAVPDQGTFAFVEMVMEDGVPKNLIISKISSRGALMVLFRDTHAILGKLEEPVELSDVQKDVFLRHLRQVFMATVLVEAEGIIEYLTARE